MTLVIVLFILGVILLALGLRLLGVKQIPVGDLLPALLLAPALVPLAALV